MEGLKLAQNGAALMITLLQRHEIDHRSSRPAVSRGTDEELRELITLWPTNSVRKYKQQHRQGAAILEGNACCLRRDCRLPPLHLSTTASRCGQFSNSIKLAAGRFHL